MKYSLLILSFSTFMISCGSASDNNQSEGELIDTVISETVHSDSEIEPSMTMTNPLPALVYTVEAFENGPNDWGYKIMNGDNMFINQPHVPAAQGNKGFSSKEKAITAGDFMLYKLEAGIVPPTVSVEELDSLGVLG